MEQKSSVAFLLSISGVRQTLEVSLPFSIPARGWRTVAGACALPAAGSTGVIAVGGLARSLATPVPNPTPLYPCLRPVTVGRRESKAHGVKLPGACRTSPGGFNDLHVHPCREFFSKDDPSCHCGPRALSEAGIFGWNRNLFEGIAWDSA